MTTNLTLQPPENKKEDNRDDLQQFVIDQVLNELGIPDNLFRVDAKHLWDDRYRVNVYCSLTQNRALNEIRITDSFHVTVDDDKISSMPPISRKYN